MGVRTRSRRRPPASSALRRLAGLSDPIDDEIEAQPVCPIVPDRTVVAASPSLADLGAGPVPPIPAVLSLPPRLQFRLPLDQPARDPDSKPDASPLALLFLAPWLRPRAPRRLPKPLEPDDE